MDANSPWLTIFNRESQSGQTAHFQVTLVQPDDKGQFLVTLMAFGLEARSTLTQVLFFKLHSSEDVLKHFSGKVSVDSEVLATVRDDIRKKLSAHVGAYVRTLPDLDVANPPLAVSLETVGSATEITADIATQQTDDADPAEIEAILAEEAIEAPGLTVASVKWNPKDDEQPDYRHLDISLASSSFDLTADDFDLLITANEFAP
jgi:hypothetical protein